MLCFVFVLFFFQIWWEALGYVSWMDYRILGCWMLNIKYYQVATIHPKITIFGRVGLQPFPNSRFLLACMMGNYGIVCLLSGKWCFFFSTGLMDWGLWDSYLPDYGMTGVYFILGFCRILGEIIWKLWDNYVILSHNPQIQDQISHEFPSCNRTKQPTPGGKGWNPYMELST